MTEQNPSEDRPEQDHAERTTKDVRLHAAGTASPILRTDLADLPDPPDLSYLDDNQRAFFLKRLVDTIPSPVFYKDAQGRYLGCNRAFEDFFGCSRQELVGRRVRDVMSPEDARSVEAMDRKLFEQPGRQMYEWRLRTATGDTRDVVFNKATFLDAEGRVAGLVGIMLDITDRKQAERVREAERQRLYDLLDSLPAFICLLTPDRSIRYANRLFRELLPAPDGGACFERIWERTQPCEHCPIDKVLEENAPQEGEWHHKPSGRIFQVHMHPFRDQDGAPLVLRSGFDITDCKRTEGALFKREEEFRALADNVPDLIARYDRKCRRTYVNRTMAQVLGKDPAALLGRAVRETGSPPAFAAAFEAAIQHVFATAEPGTIEHEALTAGGPRIHQIRLAPEFGPSGSVDSVIAVGRDVTDRKAMERELIHAREELEERVRLRTEELDAANGRLLAAKETAEAEARSRTAFLANMSHEIRTPLNGIIGMTDLALMAKPSPESVQKYLGMVREAAQSLLSVVNDVLDFSKIDSGRMEMERVEFSLRPTLDELLALLGASAREKGLRLAYEIDQSVPGRLHGPRDRLRQVLMNLVGNALKFTHRGEVTVSVSTCLQSGNAAASHPGPGTGNDMTCLLFKVRDTGIGIPGSKLESIFESYTQADGTTSQTYGGTGLGLAISRRLIEMMGGTIGVESVPGQGSEFFFTISLETAEIQSSVREEAPAYSEEQKAGPFRILLAEDDFINRTLVEELLRQRGHEVVSVDDGLQALQALSRESFDLVLMDVRMPELSGEEATRRIRNGEVKGSNPAIPVVALTAYALQGDRERFLAAGMTAYLAKPVNMDELDRIMAMVMGKARN